MANARRASGRKLQFIIKKYPDGAFSVAARRRTASRATPLVGQRALWHLLPPRGAAGADGAGRRRFGHVAAVVDPARPCRERRATARAILLRRAHARATCSTSMSSRASPRSCRTSGLSRRCRTPRPDDDWDGETGFVHEVVARDLCARKGWTARSTPMPAGRRR